MTTKVQSSFTPISWYPTPRTQQQSGGRGNCHSLSFHYLIEWRHNMMIKFRVSVSSCFCNKDHKHNGLKQHTFIMYFIVLWVMSLTWLLTGQNPRGLWGCLPSGDARGSSVSLSFSTSANFPWSLTWGPLPPSSKPAMAVVSFSHLTRSSFCLLFFHFSGSILLHWAHLDNLGQSPHPTFNWLASLIASATL